MICKNCGSQNDDGSLFCYQCGCSFEGTDNQDQGNNYDYSQQNGFQPSGGYEQNYNSQPNYNGQQSYQNYQNAQGNNNGYNPNPQNQNGNNAYNYNQNYNFAPVDTSVLKKGSIIAALVVGILIQNLFAIIFSIIALVRCNEFESAVRMGNYPLADQKRENVNSMRKWAWIFCIIGIVLYVIFGVLFVLGVIGNSLAFGDDIFDSFLNIVIR